MKERRGVGKDGSERWRVEGGGRVGRGVGWRRDGKSIENLRGISKAVLSINIEIEGERKTALDADIVFLYHFVN